MSERQSEIRAETVCVYILSSLRLKEDVQHHAANTEGPKLCYEVEFELIYFVCEIRTCNLSTCN